MKLHHFILSTCIFSVLVISACNNSGPTATVDGYELTAVPGSAFQKAVKKEAGGSVVEDGYALNGQRNGLWITYNPDGRINTMQHYIDGKLNGVSVTLDNRGQITNKAFYTNNQYDGIVASFRFGRVEERIPYTNGVINGRTTKFYTNGKVMEEIDYENGTQHGYYRHYDEAGVMDLEYVYENGEKVSGGIVTPGDEGE